MALVMNAKSLSCSSSWNLTRRSFPGYFPLETAPVSRISASVWMFSGSLLFHFSHLNWRFCLALTTKNDSSRLILASSAKALYPLSKM